MYSPSDSLYAWFLTFWFFLAPPAGFYIGMDVGKVRVEKECLSNSYFKSGRDSYSCELIMEVK